MILPISGLQYQLTPRTVFRVEMTENWYWCA
jgi:hypothetical protein